MTEGNTSYPGVGADTAIAELHSLVGQITANWASVEDQLFNVFLVAIAGTLLVGDVRPYRAVFFTFSSYEGKMRMVHNAMKSRYGEDKNVMSRWKTIRDALNEFSDLRNEIAHLIPMAKYSTDATAPANVRLIPAFWKSTLDQKDFDVSGYSVDELLQALKPFWGCLSLNPPSGDDGQQLGYRLQQFVLTLSPPPQFPPIDPSNP